MRQTQRDGIPTGAHACKTMGMQQLDAHGLLVVLHTIHHPTAREWQALVHSIHTAALHKAILLTPGGMPSGEQLRTLLSCAPALRVALVGAIPVTSLPSRNAQPNVGIFTAERVADAFSFLGLTHDARSDTQQACLALLRDGPWSQTDLPSGRHTWDGSAPAETIAAERVA